MAISSRMTHLRVYSLTSLPFSASYFPSLLSFSPSKFDVDSTIDPELPWVVPGVLQKIRRICNPGSVLIERRLLRNLFVRDYTRSTTGRSFTNKGMKRPGVIMDCWRVEKEWRTAAHNI